MTVTIASRASVLARWQAEHVALRLREAHPDLVTETLWVRTTGDRVTDVPLARIGTTGLFTREVDAALLDGRAQIGVHSLKDVPTRLPDGLVIAALPPREDPRDAFIAAPGRPASVAALAGGARIGTSSLRRRAQLLQARPDLRVEDLRGNLDTRLGRVASGELDGAVLALAGIRRLDREEVVTERLDPEIWLPACGQGALAVVARADDSAVLRRLAVLDDFATRAAVTAERAFLRALEGGCQVPIGGFARIEGDSLRLRGFVSSTDGRRRLRAQTDGPVDHAAGIGESLAEQMRGMGADAILSDIAAVRGVSPP